MIIILAYKSQNTFCQSITVYYSLSCVDGRPQSVFVVVLGRESDGLRGNVYRLRGNGAPEENPKDLCWHGDELSFSLKAIIILLH